jgi:hypothetical protein
MILEKLFEANFEVGLYRPLFPACYILAVFVSMSMLDNTTSFLLLQNLLWLPNDISSITFLSAFSDAVRGP